MKKRNKKGFAFTIGDASNHDMLKAADIKKIFGDDVQNDMTAESVADEALKTYELFHINLS